MRALGTVSRGVLFLTLVALSACSTGPSFEEYLASVRSAAPPDAVHCGVRTLDQSRAQAVACAQAAIAQRRPLVVVFQVQGIDSTIYTALVVDADHNAWTFTWDRYEHYGLFVSRFESRVRRDACSAPRLVDSEEEQPIQCQPDVRPPP